MAPAAAAAAARAAATPGAAAIRAAATLSIEQRERQCKQSYFGGGFPRYSSSSPRPRFDIDTYEGERRCNFRPEHVPCLRLLNEVAPA